MTHAASSAVPPAPGRLTLPPVVRGLAAGAAAIGALSLAWAFASGDLAAAWSAYLIGVFFVLGLGVFGVAWLAILYLAGTTWSVTMRRIARMRRASSRGGAWVASSMVAFMPLMS